jgi:glycosyltransferase involved in cell wall biosynthesis
MSANTVLTSGSFGDFKNWLSEKKQSKKKLLLVPKLVDALPTPEFFQSLERIRRSFDADKSKDEFNLLYVGRLHKEKLTDHLIEMMKIIRDKYQPIPKVVLTLVGTGPEEEHLRKMVREYGLGPFVEFVGAVSGADLPTYLTNADVFLSPLTGMALREAALAGLPVVAYDMDWISGLLQHDDTALLVAPGDFEGMAHQAMRLMKSEQLHTRLSHNLEKLAWRLWSPSGVEESLRQAFEAN